MLAPSTQIRLVRWIQLVIIVLLAVAVLGITNDYTLLDGGIAIGFILLAALAYLMKHSRLAIGAIVLAIVFNQIIPLHFERSTWIVIDILAFACLAYGTYWATDPHKKGTRFEKYVSTLFPEPHFVCIDRSRDSSKTLDRRVVSDSHPDFIFRNQKTGKTFAVECKWRGRWAQVGKSGERGIWWNLDQSARYRAYGEMTSTPVYVAFGIGGSPEKPAEVHFVEISQLTSPFLKQTLIQSGKSAMDIG